MFRIGEFARLGGVSVRTLHYYDNFGLLKPVQIDPVTGYRYYATQQLAQLKRIMTFKNLGFSLEQISQILEADFTPEQLKGLLRIQQAEFQRQLGAIQLQLEELQTWLSRLDSGETEMTTVSHDNYEIILKKIEPVLVASLRQTMPVYGYLGKPFGTLRTYIDQYAVKYGSPSIVLWHFFEGAEAGQGIEVEVAEPLAEAIPDSEQIRVYQLPELELVASVTYQGDFEGAAQAYGALGNWVEAQGYRVSGTTRQLHYAFNPQADPATYVTEFQLPIEKRSN